LALAVLFVLLLRIGAVAACTQHELADLGFAVDIVMVDQGDDDAGTDGLREHASNCTHCSCHHAAAVLQTLPTWTSAEKSGDVEGRFDDHASAHARLTLRPPIA
jgi:hypothetical protein